MIIAIDVDNTLLTEQDGMIVLNMDVVALMRAIYNLGLADIVVWSGGGADYAATVVRRFGIGNLVHRCAGKNDPVKPDITIDDQETGLGSVNLRLTGDITPTPWMGKF
jgi:hypothetical protein